MYIIGTRIYIVCTILCLLFRHIYLLYGRFLCWGGRSDRMSGIWGGDGYQKKDIPLCFRNILYALQNTAMAPSDLYLKFGMTGFSLPVP